MKDDYLTVAEAAARSGMHPNTIQRLVRQGKLHGYKENQGGRSCWLVSIRSLDNYTDPWSGFLLDRPGPKIYLTKRDEDKKRPPESGG